MFAAKNHESLKAKAEKPSAQGNAKSGAPGRVQVNPLWHQFATRVQAKPTVNAPDGPSEREAERTADIQSPLPVASSAEEGQPLEAGIRGPMERFFQHRLDQVRVFCGADSRHAAEAHGAYALTHGQNIHLGPRGQSLPGKQKKALLAHEAAHTIQQRAAPPATQLSALTPDAEASPQERQAGGLSF
jgi:hypothetical protein